MSPPAPGGPGEEPAPVEADEKPLEAISRRKPRRWLRWLLALFLLAGGLGGAAWWWYTPRPHSLPPPEAKPTVATPAPVVVTPPPPPEPLPDLRELKVQTGPYEILAHPQGGQTLFITGVVINTGTVPRGPVRLKVNLLDAKHRSVREVLAYSGTELRPEELRTLPPEVVQGWLNTPGGRSQTRLVKPGEKQPFTVVFFKVPDNFREVQPGYDIKPVEGAAVAEAP